MAKENKKTAENAAPVTNSTVENIYESLDSESMGRKELADSALAKIKEQQDERTKNAMMQRFQKSRYLVDRKLLNLRRERGIAKVTKEELVHVDRLSRALMGFTVTEEIIESVKNVPDSIFEKETVDAKAKTMTIVISGEKKTFKVGEEVPPTIDYVDFDTMYEKITDYVRKKTNEVEKIHDEYNKKLRAKYGEYWNSSWYY